MRSLHYLIRAPPPQVCLSIFDSQHFPDDEDPAVLGDVRMNFSKVCLRGLYDRVGQLNPLVTISALLTRNIKPLLALLYIVAQIGGAIVGVVIQIGLLPTTSDQLGCFTPIGVTKGQMFGLELLGSLLFVLLVQGIALRFASFLNVYVDLTADQYGNTGPLAIGLTITGLAFSMGQYTGGAFNPARVLAPAIIFRCETGFITVIYVLAEVAGAVLASAIAFVAYGVKKPAVKMLNQVEQTPLMGETGQSSVNNASLGPRETYNIYRRSMGPERPQMATQV